MNRLARLLSMLACFVATNDEYGVIAVSDPGNKFVDKVNAKNARIYARIYERMNPDEQ